MNKEQKQQTVTIKAPNFQIVTIPIRGTAPLVIHKFSKRTADQIVETQAQGEQQARGKKRKPPKDFDRIFNEARHISEDGWDGIHAGGFRAAAVSACRVAGFQMTKAKLSVFIMADGVDKEDGMPLVRIIGKAEKHISHARNDNGSIDMRARPMYRTWGCNLRVRYDGDQFTAEDVFNLIARVGVQVGIGEGRPDSKNSTGTGWGTFEIVGNKEKIVGNRKKAAA